jgi:hypothetical protein
MFRLDLKSWFFRQASLAVRFARRGFVAGNGSAERSL